MQINKFNIRVYGILINENKQVLIAEELIKTGETNTVFIIESMKRVIDSVTTSKLDYIKIVDAVSFNEIPRIEKGNRFYILIACRIGKTRLIDNTLIRA